MIKCRGADMRKAFDQIAFTIMRKRELGVTAEILNVNGIKITE
jgi:hypothetical protein